MPGAVSPRRRLGPGLEGSSAGDWGAHFGARDGAWEPGREGVAGGKEG